jgi:type II secretory pathway pseudopilin PulG
VSPRAFQRGLAKDDGFSVIEVLVAALILTLTATAIAVLANSATHNTFRAEQDQVVVNRLQNEVERIRQLPFSQVTLTARPASSNQAGDPAERVSADGTHFDLNRNGTNTKALAYAGGTTPDGKPVGCGATGQPACGVNPGPESFQSGDVSGKIYRYVAYPGVPANCPGCSADYFKRIIVIIRLDTTPAGGAHVYQEIQSNVSSPDAVPSSNPVDPTQTTDQQSAMFWLTDTPCNNTARVAPTSDHDTHNTRGGCTDGGQTGTTRGAPDLMVTNPPTGSGSDPTYNYSTDVQRTESPKFGLAMLKPQTTPGCALQVANGNAPNQTLDLPSVETTPQLEMHTWLSTDTDLNSSPTFANLTSADATLELWTKSVGAAAYQGDVCVYVFKRITVQQQLPGNVTNTFVVDSPATINLTDHLYLEIQKATWPQTWTKLSTGSFNLTMLSVNDVLTALSNNGVPGTLTSPSQRLGLALTINSSGTSGDALEMMYDQQTFDSRFELDTPKGTCVIPCP